jgi:hypothetical protein
MIFLKYTKRKGRALTILFTAQHQYLGSIAGVSIGLQQRDMGDDSIPQMSSSAFLCRFSGPSTAIQGFKMDFLEKRTRVIPLCARSWTLRRDTADVYWCNAGVSSEPLSNAALLQVLSIVN